MPSPKLTSCRTCGAEKLRSTHEINVWSGNCNSCQQLEKSQNKIVRTGPKTSKKSFREATCRTCNVVWQKRSETFKDWNGECLSCAHKTITARPDIKRVLRQNGVRVGKFYGAFAGAATRFPKLTNESVPEMTAIRRSPVYTEWRRLVFERDDYTCIFCRQRGGKLEADHIKPFVLYPELRTVVENGRTTCKACHKKHGWRGSHVFAVAA